MTTYSTSAKQRDGFGLIEVMFAGAVFVVVVGGMVTLGRLALRNAALATQRTQAMNLAQEGIETVRQMRDTAWIDDLIYQEDGSTVKDWQTYVHDCYNQSTDAGDKLKFRPIAFNTQYAICYDTLGNPPLNRYGLMPIAANCQDISVGNKADSCIRLLDDLNQHDPGSPPYYRRTIEFRAVPATTASGGSLEFPGLQLLESDADNQSILSLDAEPYHFVNVIVTIEWTAFDRPWSVKLETMLTNWRGK